MGNFFKDLVTKGSLAGNIVREATGNVGGPVTARNMIDPAGLLNPQQPGAGSTPLKPYNRIPLSAGAQAIRDRMTTRRAAMTGGAGLPTLPTMPIAPAAPAPMRGVNFQPRPMAPQPMVGAPVAPQPMMGAPGNIQRGLQPIQGQGFRDGGMVKKSKQKNSSTKVFNRKPNGKPY